MTGKQAIQTALKGTQHLVNWYLSDLTDADLIVRPVPSANHIAWQLGHFISSESRLTSVIPGGVYPPLPAGFAELHGKEGATADKGFATKAQYLDLFTKTRAATLDLLERLPDADLDKPNTGPMAQFAPTFGALFLLASNHTLMHLGQFTVVRRKLGKPVLF